MTSSRSARIDRPSEGRDRSAHPTQVGHVPGATVVRGRAHLRAVRADPAIPARVRAPTGPATASGSRGAGPAPAAQGPAPAAPGPAPAAPGPAQLAPEDPARAPADPGRALPMTAAPTADRGPMPIPGRRVATVRPARAPRTARRRSDAGRSAHPSDRGRSVRRSDAGRSAHRAIDHPGRATPRRPEASQPSALARVPVAPDPAAPTRRPAPVDRAPVGPAPGAPPTGDHRSSGRPCRSPISPASARTRSWSPAGDRSRKPSPPAAPPDACWWCPTGATPWSSWSFMPRRCGSRWWRWRAAP